MSLTIYTSKQSGGVNPAREFILNQIVKCYKKTKFNKRRKIYVLTPKQDTYQVERELIDLVGDGGLLGIQITDFESFIQRMVQEERPKVNIVDIHGQLMLLQKALLNIEDQLGIYRSSIQEPNFKTVILDEIGMLKQAQLAPEKIERGLDNVTDNLLKNKLKDLSIILKEFNNLLGKEHFDDVELNSLALSLIPESKFLEDIQIFCLDENSISYPEILFLLSIDKKVKRIEIALNTDLNPYSPDFSAYMIPNQVLNTFKRLAKELGVKINLKNLPLEKNISSLDYLASELFSYNPEPYKGKDQKVTLFQAKDPWDEVKQVAQNILKDNLNGIAFSSIAVASNSPTEYESIIKRVFSQYGIPYFIDENHKIIDNQFIQSVLSALDSINSKFNRSDILSYIKSEFSGLTPDETDLIENYLIEAGIRSFEWNKPFKRVPRAWRLEEKELDNDHPVVAIQNKILENLKPLSNLTRKKHTINEYIQKVQDYLINTKSQERLEEIAELVSKNEEQELSSRYRQIWNILQEILSQMQSVLGEERMSFSDFITILKSGITSYDIGVIPEDNEAVIISSLERTRLPETQNLYFLGLNEDLVPLKHADETLLTDFDKNQLIKYYEVSNQIVQNKEFSHQLEENNLWFLLTKASNKVYFTYHTYTTSGDRAYPSRYVDVLLKIFGKQIFQKPTKFFSLLSPSRANVILENFLNDNEYNKIKRILNEWFLEHPESLNTVKTLPVKPEDSLEELDIRDLFEIQDDKNRVNISRLENFASCPFKHFIDYGIKLHDREEFEVRSFDTGIFIHEVYDRFLSSLVDKTNKNPQIFHENVQKYLDDWDYFEENFEKIFNKIVEELEEVKRYQHTAASRHLITKVKRICKLATRIMLEQFRDSEFTPIEFEQYFYDKRDDGIVIEGRIDRIDVNNDKHNPLVRVVDYKTGDRKINYIDLLYGKSLQLAIYLNEALKRFGKDALPKGAYYFITKHGSFDYKDDLTKDLVKDYKMNGINKETGTEDEDIKGGTSKNQPNKLNDLEIDSLMNYSTSLVKTLTDELSSGNIKINPVFIDGKNSSCKYCNYKDICRFNVNNTEFEFNKFNSINKDEFFEKIKESEDQNG